MSEPIGASIDFSARFSAENVTTLIECVRAAVLENWEKHSDEYARATERTPHLEALELPAAANQIVEGIEAGKDVYESGRRASSTEHFSYSPLSNWAPYLTFWRRADGTLGVCFTILSSKPPYELQGDRERSRMESEWEAECLKRGKPWHDVLRACGPEWGELDEEAYYAWWDKYHSLGEGYSPSVWPQNRQSFLNVVKHLKNALPVKEVWLDPPFLQGE
jgi:hypothetical protein